MRNTVLFDFFVWLKELPCKSRLHIMLSGRRGRSWGLSAFIHSVAWSLSCLDYLIKFHHKWCPSQLYCCLLSFDDRVPSHSIVTRRIMNNSVGGREAPSWDWECMEPVSVWWTTRLVLDPRGGKSCKRRWLENSATQRCGYSLASEPFALRGERGTPEVALVVFVAVNGAAAIRGWLLELLGDGVLVNEPGNVLLLLGLWLLLLLIVLVRHLLLLFHLNIKRVLS